MFARKHVFSFVEFSNSQPTLNFMHRSKDLFGFQADIFPVIPFQSLHSSGKYYELGGRGRGRVSSEREMHRKEVAACFKQNRCSCSYSNSKWGGKQDFPHLPSHHLKNMSSRLGLHKIFWVVIETSHWIWEREGERHLLGREIEGLKCCPRWGQ